MSRVINGEVDTTELEQMTLFTFGKPENAFLDLNHRILSSYLSLRSRLHDDLALSCWHVLSQISTDLMIED
ncbi:MAG: hypothetical protein AAGD25_37750 [Cyanobacteria bacterium P01_F01_bin.150]